MGGKRDACVLIAVVLLLLFLWGVVGFTIYALSEEGEDARAADLRFLDQIYGFCILFSVACLVSCITQCLKAPKGDQDYDSKHVCKKNIRTTLHTLGAIACMAAPIWGLIVYTGIGEAERAQIKDAFPLLWADFNLILWIYVAVWTLSFVAIGMAVCCYGCGDSDSKSKVGGSSSSIV
eukprot:m.71101 g.71101  ORF g.71101 m.71101 type:complete len:178 (-) comp16076_c0_seq2:206-739(-)